MDPDNVPHTETQPAESPLETPIETGSATEAQIAADLAVQSAEKAVEIAETIQAEETRSEVIDAATVVAGSVASEIASHNQSELLTWQTEVIKSVMEMQQGLESLRTIQAESTSAILQRLSELVPGVTSEIAHATNAPPSEELSEAPHNPAAEVVPPTPAEKNPPPAKRGRDWI